MLEKTETRRTVKRWKIVIIGIGRIKCLRRRMPRMQPYNNKNILI